MNGQRQGLSRYLQSLGCEVFAYGNASHGFKDILLYLKNKRRGGALNVVMPSFIPAKLYRTVLAAGYEPKFYDIGDGCRFDPEQVEKLIDERTTSIFGIHYFGCPTDLASLREIAARHGVALIEDCAHVLLAESGGKPLGTLGDFSIFSTRKMLQLSDGGLLAINTGTDGFTPTYDGRVRSTYTGSRFLLSRAKRSYLQLLKGRDVLRVARVADVGWIDPKRAVELRVRKMSHLTTMIGNMSDIRQISSIRKANYKRLYGALREFEFLQPVYCQPPDTWTPYSLPMVVDKGRRPLLLAELLRDGISCGLGWPESPFCKYADGTRELAARLIEFPVHPLMFEAQFERMIDACKAFRKKYCSS